MSSLQKLKFSYNWNNKLHCDAFTTLRLQSDKYKLGEVYAVELKGKFLKNARIQGITPLKLNDINQYIAQLDTGYSVQECQNIIKRMYSKSSIDWATQKIYLILCVTEKQ